MKKLFLLKKGKMNFYGFLYFSIYLAYFSNTAIFMRAALCVNQSIMRSCPLLSSSYKLRLLSIFNAIFFFL